MANLKTYSMKPREVQRKWYVLDASEVPLGRLSTAAARLLLGKDKPTFTAHIDGGDYVIVINSDKLVATGNKSQGKVYYRHSGFPGGLRQRTMGDAVKQSSESVIRHAVRGMLPDNKLRAGRLERLKIYDGEEQPHAGQNPERVSLGKRNKDG